MRVLALDFDGVLCNSAPECFAVALRTYRAINPDSELAESDSLYAGFLDLMPLGNRAEDFGVALAALEEGTRLTDQSLYDVFRSGLGDDWLAAFHERFYRERRALEDADPAAWLALMAPYPPLFEILRRHAADVVLAIATAKDRHSVARLLEAFGAADLFPEERVLDKETGVSKVTHLEALRRALDVEFAEITFVDDKVNHLDSVAGLGVRCGLAAWGFNGPREERLAREQGYLVLELDRLEGQLFATL